MKSERLVQSVPSAKNPLQGMTLEQILIESVDQLGWEYMAREIDIRCFTHEPSIQSSLKFLRRTPWARAKVEALYVKQVYSAQN